MAENVLKANNIKTKMLVDVSIAVAIISVVFIMIIPVPGFILDFLLALNLSLGIIIMLTAVYVKKVLDFSSFPSLLLLITIFGLGLNISTTRQILLLGPQMKVELIKAFGDFVVGGNYVVGFIIFLILIIIQFIVISKGATRVSEVAARFRLDATPGKQMAIISDLDAGLITQEEATLKKEELNRENEFYGDMDGASKFVQGNIIAAFIINLINIIGGLIVGVAMRGEGITSALKTYTLFTVGDGLLSQIPSLLIATSMGILVTRATEDEELSKELVSQITGMPKVMYISGGLLIILGIIAPLPKLQVIGLGVLFVSLAYITSNSIKKKEKLEQAAEIKTAEAKPAGPIDVTDILSGSEFSVLGLEFGFSLIPVFDANQGGDLLERITMMRKQFAINVGLPVPSVRIRDNITLESNEYIIKIKDAEVDRAKIMIGYLLAINPGTAKEEIESGIDTLEPAFKIPAKWIPEKDKERAEKMGYTIVDPATMIVTHLQELIKKYSREILTRQDLIKILKNFRDISPSVAELLDGHKTAEGNTLKYTTGILHTVFTNLLEENIPIKDVVTIADVLIDHIDIMDNPFILTEFVREQFKIHITNMAKDAEGTVRVITVDPDIEEQIDKTQKVTPQGIFLGLDSDTTRKLRLQFQEAINYMVAKGYKAVVLCDPNVRAAIWTLLKGYLKTVYVVSYNEILEGTDLEAERTISL